MNSERVEIPRGYPLLLIGVLLFWPIIWPAIIFFLGESEASGWFGTIAGFMLYQLLTPGFRYHFPNRWQRRILFFISSMSIIIYTHLAGSWLVLPLCFLPEPAYLHDTFAGNILCEIDDFFISTAGLFTAFFTLFGWLLMAGIDLFNNWAIARAEKR